MVKRLVMIVAVAMAAAACGGDDPAAFVDPDQQTDDCRVRLHGKSGDGRSWRLDDGIAVISPRGNDEGWGGYQWNYLTEANYAEARTIVGDAIEATGCTRVAVHGFSNGASMAAKLACDPATADWPVVGYVVDDPVTDDATLGCERTDGVEVAVYWTGALGRSASPGTSCAGLDWTCEGGAVRGIDAFAADLGVEWAPSIHTEHTWYDDAPELVEWLS